MSNGIQIKVPDIGDFSDVPVIEVFVKVGDTVKAEDPLVSLESDKATMDVPSPQDGTVESIQVNVGDKVGEGTVLMTFAAAGAAGGGSAGGDSAAGGAAAAGSSGGNGGGSAGQAAGGGASGSGQAAGGGSGQSAGGGASGSGAQASTGGGAASGGDETPVTVPDIGDFSDVPVIEIHVKPGDTVKAEDALVTLESDKATMDVPSPRDGIVRAVNVSVGDKVSEGTVIITIAGAGGSGQPAAGGAQASQPAGGAAQGGGQSGAQTGGQGVAQGSGPQGGASQGGGAQGGSQGGASQGGASQGGTSQGGTSQGGASQGGALQGAALAGGPIDEDAFRLAYASPSVRLLARQLGVNLGHVKGSGEHGRILQSDVESASRSGAAGAGAGAKAGAPAAAAPAGGGGGGLDLLPWPKVDFAKFGPIERQARSRIKKISAANLHRNWVMIPHVTSQDEADITDLEQFRQTLNREFEKSKSPVKLSLLPFMMKAAVATLKKFPEFNASLDGDDLVLKQYYHLGFAADTPNGLMVPVVRDCDQKSIPQIATEMAELAKLARDGKLKPDQMQGGTFTISSLGGIGGTFFTPIINAPEVAIMGVCRSYWKQVSSDGRNWEAKLIQPLSLSWDHRVIDGAAAARFNAHFANLLADMRRVLI